MLRSCFQQELRKQPTALESVHISHLKMIKISFMQLSFQKHAFKGCGIILEEDNVIFVLHDLCNGLVCNDKKV